MNILYLRKKNKRHSWLEHQETLFGRTMVIFINKSIENMVISDKFSEKVTIVNIQKLLIFNLMPYH